VTLVEEARKLRDKVASGRLTLTIEEWRLIIDVLDIVARDSSALSLAERLVFTNFTIPPSRVPAKRSRGWLTASRNPKDRLAANSWIPAIRQRLSNAYARQRQRLLG
jgi:hypothetical protein